ncbi:MAG: hypothetical protein K2H83_07960 [Duncaniella sp.]|nr:hypothetical protein [Duncaniella sp.]
MLRRTAYILILILASALNASATMATGAWKNYPVAGEFSHLIDAGQRVWYVSGGHLSYYDKEAGETYSYEAGRDLSDFVITGLYRNNAGRYVVVTYDNSNIDIVYDDASKGVVNIPDIRDSAINADKTVTSVAFHGDNIYVGTLFGLVIVDEKRAEIKESGIYNSHGINSLCALADGLLISPSGYSDDHYPLLFHRWGERIHRYENFTVLMQDAGHTFTSLTPLGGNMAAGRQWGRAKLIQAKPSVPGAGLGNIYTSSSVYEFSRLPDKGVAFLSTDGYLCSTDSLGQLSQSRYALPESLRKQLMSTSGSYTRGFWLASEDGLGEYRIREADGSTEVLRDKSRPSDATTFSSICRIYPDASGRGFIISNLGTNTGHPVGKGDRMDIPMKADAYIDGQFTEIDPEVTTSSSFTQGIQNSLGKKKVLCPTWISEDPDTPGRYYISSGAEGLYVVDGNKQAAHFTEANSPFYRPWMLFCSYNTIDHKGNLWVASTTLTSGKTTVFMLPAEKRRRADLSTITKADWVETAFGNTIFEKDAFLVVCRHSNIVLSFDRHPSTAFEALRHNGNLTDAGSFRYASWPSVTDTDGKAFAPSWRCGVEDKKGTVWIGTDMGVVTIPNPNSVMESGFAINRVKVPRNDGTNLADYLLESENIIAIAVDNSNRKWIGTANSGLYLVSENGDEIISHYTTDNSPLPSNAICGLHADPSSNSLFIATLSGLLELSTDSSPAMDDYSEAYAYPNPLTPDYTGWVTITGLMADSMVKIVDQNMNLVYQTTSEGGMATWDGCNMNGQRVRSGVYYVLASSGGESAASASSAAVATKILVIN